VKLASPSIVGFVYSFLAIVLAFAGGTWLILGFFAVLFYLHLITFTLLEILKQLSPPEETLEERKQRRWKEYEDSIVPPRDG
jgi:hypothetical protein